MTKEDIVVVILTFNSESIIDKTINAAFRVSPLVVAVDSNSTDKTPIIVKELGCQLYKRPFENYSDQRNWAIRKVQGLANWQLHIDADEVLDEAAVEEIARAVHSPHGRLGFMLRRRTYFMGRPLRFGGATSWHLRLFYSDSGRCEDRLYDQHFICNGSVGRIRCGYLHDMNVGSLTEWTNRHNRWSDLEASELTLRVRAVDQIDARLSDDPRERRRYYKNIYYRAPRLLRPTLYFCWRYLAMGGFLDGRVGFIYSALQAFWFRLLVDAKLIEREEQEKREFSYAQPNQSDGSQ